MMSRLATVPITILSRSERSKVIPKSRQLFQNPGNYSKTQAIEARFSQALRYFNE
jgi:hypothetical protein